MIMSVEKKGIIASFRTNAEYKETNIYEQTYPLFFPLQHFKFENSNVIEIGRSLVIVIIKVSEN